MSAKKQVNDGLVQPSSCPGNDISIEKIYSALVKEDVFFQRLVGWFADDRFVSKCHDHRDCRLRRVNASFGILNAIRSACKPYLDRPSTSKDRKSPTQQSSQPKNPSVNVIQAPVSYEDQFPSLGKETTPNSDNRTLPLISKIPQNSNVKSKKQKKRIRPVATVAPAKTNIGVWGNIAKQPAVNSSGPSRPWSTAKMASNTEMTTQPAKSNNPIVLQKGKVGTTGQPHKTCNQQSKNVYLQNWKGGNGKKTGTIKLKDQEHSLESNTAFTHNNIPVSTPLKSRPEAHDKPFDPSYSNVNVVTPRPRNDQNTKSVTPSRVKPADDTVFKRFVEIHCTLIRNCLVPSITLEIHLLLRLLTVEVPTNSEVDVLASSEVLTPIFSSPDRCRKFAVNALTFLAPELKSFGLNFLRKLVEGECFRSCLPELTDELETIIHRQSNTEALLLTTEQAPIISSGNQTAILTIPFKEERDSRHNFRTRIETSMYKNREETRDAFLFQLRSFLNVKGKVLDTFQSQRQMKQICGGFHSILNSVMNANLPWFSQFFCELLLQIGIVPIEEMDKELLDITDKDKLQKLHKRFSSKVGAQSNKSSWKVNSEKHKKNSTPFMSPVDQAQEHFPGYQEYFFLFLTSTDSYKFNCHLKNQIICSLKQKLADCNNNRPTFSLEQNLLKMQMLSRFLGFLVFSPCWAEFDGSRNNVSSRADSLPVDGLTQLESDSSGGLVLSSLVRQAQAQGNLALVVPWVTDFLKMSLWDTTIRTRSTEYTDIIALLDHIQEKISISRSDSLRSDGSLTGQEVVFWCLEAFFGEQLTLIQAASLVPRRVEISARVENDKLWTLARDGDALDLKSSQFAFGSNLMFAANPHMEELLSLVASFSNPRSMKISTRSPGVSRKLRPSIVSHAVSPNEETRISNNNADDRTLFTGSGLQQSKSADMIKSNGPSFEGKMLDTFFHQHPELKHICEFCVTHILKNMTAKIRERIAQRGNDFYDDSAAMEADLLSFLRVLLEEGLNQSLSILAPQIKNNPQVCKIAISLAVTKGYEAGYPFVKKLVKEDLYFVQRSLFIDGDETRPKDNVCPAPSSSAEEGFMSGLVKLTTSISDLSADLSVNTAEKQVSRILPKLSAIETLIEPAFADPQIPPEGILRDHFEAVAKLDRVSVEFVKVCVRSPVESDNDVSPKEQWMVLRLFLGVASKLSSPPRLGLSRIRKLLRSADFVYQLALIGLEFENGEVISCLLCDLFCCNLLPPSVLENALVDIEHQESNGKAAFLEECKAEMTRRSLTNTEDCCLERHKQTSPRSPKTSFATL